MNELTDERSPVLSALGAQIRDLRDEKGWTQEELAEKAQGLDKETVNRVELGRNTRVSTLLRIAEALGVELGVYVGGQGAVQGLLISTLRFGEKGVSPRLQRGELSLSPAGRDQLSSPSTATEGHGTERPDEASPGVDELRSSIGRVEQHVITLQAEVHAVARLADQVTDRQAPVARKERRPRARRRGRGRR